VNMFQCQTEHTDVVHGIGTSADRPLMYGRNEGKADCLPAMMRSEDFTFIEFKVAILTLSFLKINPVIICAMSISEPLI